MAKTLPYTDTKPRGAPDFYFAVNATLRFLERELGEQGLKRWLREMAADYFAPVNEAWRQGGLPAVAAYWRDFFAAEPGSEVTVSESPEEVTVEVRRCPAIAHLRANRREIFPGYCRHCLVLGRARAAAAGLSMSLEGGDGSCIQRFRRENETPGGKGPDPGGRN